MLLNDPDLNKYKLIETFGLIYNVLNNVNFISLFDRINFSLNIQLQSLLMIWIEKNYSNIPEKGNAFHGISLKYSSKVAWSSSLEIKTISNCSSAALLYPLKKIDNFGIKFRHARHELSLKKSKDIILSIV